MWGHGVDPPSDPKTGGNFRPRPATELAQRTSAVLRIAFLASSALEWVSTFAIGMVAMYVGATLLGYVRAPLLPSHPGAQAGVFVLLLAPAYFAPLRRFAAAYHQRQEAVAAAEILAPLSGRAPGDTGQAPAPQAPARGAAVVTAHPPAVVLQDATVRLAGRVRPRDPRRGRVRDPDGPGRLAHRAVGPDRALSHVHVLLDLPQRGGRGPGGGPHGGALR
jgi:ATP-binding cassette subfamily C protein CydD